MKRIISMVIFSCLLIASSSLLTYLFITQHDYGSFNGITDWDISFEEKNPSIDFKMDEELALAIGNAIIKSHTSDKFMKETKYSVRELKGKDIYVVSRVPKVPQLGRH